MLIKYVRIEIDVGTSMEEKHESVTFLRRLEMSLGGHLGRNMRLGLLRFDGIELSREFRV